MVIRELVTLLGFELKDAPLKQYDKQIDSTKEKSGGLANAARGVGVAWKIAAAAVAVGVGWISKNIIQATVEMEGYRTQLQAFTGDADSAAATLEALRDKTIDPLFGTGNLVNAYKQMRTVGMGAEETSKMIDVLGDVANGSAENFNALNNVLLTVSTTGKVNSRTMKQLAASGFGAQDMAQGLGISVERLNADLEAGKIGFDDLKKAMEGATKEGGRFYMNAANQALTLGGSIKILKSTIGGIGDAIGTKVAPALANMIGYVNELIKLGKSGLVDFGAKAFNYLIHVIAQVIIFFEVFNMRMNKYGGAFTALKGIFQDVFGFFKSVIQSAWPFLMNLAQLILVAFKPLRAFVQPVLESLKPIFKTVFGLLAGIFGELITIVDELTPHFAGIGKAVGSAFEKIVPLLENIKSAILAAFKPIKAFLKPIIESLQPLFEKVFGAIGRLFSKAGEDTKGLAGVIEGLTPIFSLLGNIVSVFIDIFGAGLAWIIDTFGPFLKYILIIIGAIKAWSIVQGILNLIMSLNPIGAIILAVVALIAIVGLLVKNWDKVKEFFINLWEGIKNIFLKAWEFIKDLFLKYHPVGLIIKNWETIKQFFIDLWENVKKIFSAAWEGIKNVFGAVGNFFAGVWDGVKNTASKAWEGVKNITASVWDGIKNIFIGVVNSIKNIWNGVIGFFTGLWEALKQGPAEALEYIKNAFLGLFDNIKEKFFGFINIIQSGWEKVKGFFSGIGKGVADFFTGGQPQPAYAGGAPGTPATARSSLSNSAMQSAAANNVYNNGGNSSQTINANSNINVSVPPGTTQEQARAISQQVDRAVQNSFASAIGGARGTIPSPEARRN